jgi:hypothetical protein
LSTPSTSSRPWCLSLPQWWLRLWIAHHKIDVTDGDGLGRRRLVVITDFDKFYDVYRRRSIPPGGWIISDAARTELQDALWCMSEFVSCYKVNYETDVDDEERQTTGSYRERKVEWYPEFKAGDPGRSSDAAPQRPAVIS